MGDPCRLDWRRPLLVPMQCNSAQRSLPCSRRWAGSRAKPLSRTASFEAPLLLRLCMIVIVLGQPLQL